MDHKTGTVRDLIKVLKEYDPESLVVLQGCDCEGNWNTEITSGECRDEKGNKNGKPFVLLGRD